MHMHMHTLADESDYKKPAAGVPGLKTMLANSHTYI